MNKKTFTNNRKIVTNFFSYCKKKFFYILVKVRKIEKDVTLDIMFRFVFKAVVNVVLAKCGLPYLLKVIDLAVCIATNASGKSIARKILFTFFIWEIRALEVTVLHLTPEETKNPVEGRAADDTGSEAVRNDASPAATTATTGRPRGCINPPALGSRFTCPLVILKYEILQLSEI